MTRAALLAAGMGRRLGVPEPKALLSLGGESLMARHLRILAHCGIERIDVAVGYRAEAIEAELARLGAGGVRCWYNPHYDRGSVLSLHTLEPAFTAGEPVLFMDADVLYDHRLMARLLEAEADNAFLMDRHIAGDEAEAVKLCLAGGRLVDLDKQPTRAHDSRGEWIGFARFAPATAADIAARAAAYARAGRSEAMYEAAFREAIYAAPAGRFEVVDASDLPWIEIDFPEDLERAEREILPRLAEPSP